MRDESLLSDDLLTEVSPMEKKLLADFMRISTHPVSSPGKVEAHILTSLALALRNTHAGA